MAKKTKGSARRWRILVVVLGAAIAAVFGVNDAPARSRGKNLSASPRNSGKNLSASPSKPATVGMYLSTEFSRAMVRVPPTTEAQGGRYHWWRRENGTLVCCDTVFRTADPFGYSSSISGYQCYPLARIGAVGEGLLPGISPDDQAAQKRPAHRTFDRIFYIQDGEAFVRDGTDAELWEWRYARLQAAFNGLAPREMFGAPLYDSNLLADCLLYEFQLQSETFCEWKPQRGTAVWLALLEPTIWPDRVELRLKEFNSADYQVAKAEAVRRLAAMLDGPRRVWPDGFDVDRIRSSVLPRYDRELWRRFKSDEAKRAANAGLAEDIRQLIELAKRGNAARKLADLARNSGDNRMVELIPKGLALDDAGRLVELRWPDYDAWVLSEVDRRAGEVALEPGWAGGSYDAKRLAEWRLHLDLYRAGLARADATPSDRELWAAAMRSLSRFLAAQASPDVGRAIVGEWDGIQANAPAPVSP